MNIFLFSTMLASSLAQPATRSLNTRAVPNPCSTHTGDQCVFPFTYQGVEYLRCTYADSPTPWCATQVDDAGVVVTNRWGDCDTGSLSSCEPETNSTSCTEADSGETFVSGRNSCVCNNGVLDCSTACTPGELFNIDCNTCVCTSLGEATCTTNECGASSSTTTTTTTAPAASCNTVGGPAQGSPCIFPFIFADTTTTTTTAPSSSTTTTTT